MKRVLLIFGILLSSVVHSSPPTQAVELSRKNMEILGFNFKLTKVGDENYVRLQAPIKIDTYWEPVTTQVYPHDKKGIGSLSKIELGSPSGEVSINAYYNPVKQDLMIGVYYLCKSDFPPCKGNWDSRLYLISSIEKFLITSQSSSQPSAAGTPQSGAPN